MNVAPIPPGRGHNRAEMSHRQYMMLDRLIAEFQDYKGIAHDGTNEH